MRLRIKKFVVLALALAIACLISYGDLHQASARELQSASASQGSASGKGSEDAVETYVSGSPPLKYGESSPSTSSSLRFTCDPRSHGVKQYEGGTVAYCRKKDLELATTDSALIEIKPGAARAPHWHDTWEQQVMISGMVKTYLLDEKGRVHEELLTGGMVSVLPAGMTHWIEAIGDQPAVLLLSFPAGFKTYELDDSMIQVGKNDRACASRSTAPCRAKSKSLILMLKDGLI